MRVANVLFKAKHDISKYFKVKIYDRYLVGLGPREASVVRLEEGENSVTEVALKQYC